jgi:hypothetical protein
MTIRDWNFDYYRDHEHVIEVARFEVEVEGIHNFKELYKRIYDWLVFEDYNNIYYDMPEFYETLYLERQMATHKEHHIWWRAYKQPIKDINSEYFYYFFKINFHTIRIKPAEVMHKGKKWSTHDSDSVLRIVAYLIINDENWENKNTFFHGFLMAIRPRFKAWLYKDKIWFHREFLYRKAFELQNVIKDYLGERLSQEIPPSIYPQKGLG